MGWLNGFRPACSLDCVYCGASGRFRHARSFEHQGETMSLYECTTCGSLIYDMRDKGGQEAAPSGEIDTEARRNARYLIESGLSIRHIAKYVLSALPDLSPQDLRNHLFVEVGAGLGMASYVAGAVFGMSTVTLASSEMGGITKEILGLDVHNLPFIDLPDDVRAAMASKPACLHLDSFVEHLADPFAVICDLLSRAKVEIVAAVVPDASGLDFDLPLGEALPFLAPHDHRHLPTRRGMEKLLRRLGFAHVRVDQDDGLLTAVGSRAHAAIPGDRSTTLAERLMLEHLMRHENARVASGAAARLLPIAVFDGNATLMAALRERLPYEQNADDLLQRIEQRAWDELPFHVGPSCYWLAVEAKRAGRSDGALALIRVSAAFADAMEADNPHLAATARRFREAASRLEASIRIPGDPIETLGGPIRKAGPPTSDVEGESGRDEPSRPDQHDDSGSEAPIFVAECSAERGSLARMGA